MCYLFASSFNMVEVAVLLCTCNGARFVEQQIDSGVEHLLPDLASPVVCFTDSLMFYWDCGEWLLPRRATP